MHNAWDSFKEYSPPQDRDIYYMKPGISTCWKAAHLRKHETHVIKVFDWSIIDDAKNELKTAKQLKNIKHPNLVRIIKVGQKKELGVYYVMECWGDDLRQAIKSIRPRLEDVVNIIIQVLKGLSELHKYKLVHRDIKHENIFIKNGMIKVGDYGLVKSQRWVTQLSTAGTPGYMPPEPRDARDKRWDIYSVGVVLRELLTWEHPPFKSLAKAPANIPETLWQVVEKAMAEDPEKRFNSVEGFIEALEVKSSIQKPLSITLQDENEGKQLKTLSSVNEIKEPIDQYDYSNIIRRSSNPNDKPDTLVETLWRQFPNADQTEPTAINKTIKIGEALLKATIDRFGTQHAEVADVLENLAQLQVKKGDYVSAEKSFQQLAQIDERLYGNSSLEVIDDTIHRAYVYVKMGRLSEAEILYNGALSRYRQTARKPDLTLVTVMNNLAGVYYRQKKHLKAQELYHQALQTGEQLFKKKWPGRWLYLYNLALIYEAMDNKSAARSLYQQALVIAGKIMQPDDERFKMIRNKLKE